MICDNVVPAELISRAKDKLHVFNCLLLQDDGGINMKNPLIQNGVYWLLEGIINDMDQAFSILTKKMEIRSE